MILVTVELSSLGALINDFIYRENFNQKLFANEISLTPSELSCKLRGNNWNYGEYANIKQFIKGYYETKTRPCPYFKD